MRNSSLLLTVAGLIGCCGVPASRAQSTDARPAITGVSHVAFYAKDPEASKQFYAGLLGLADTPDRPNRYEVGEHQAIEIEKLPEGHGPDLLSHVAFATSDAEGMRRFLANHGVKVPDKVSPGGGGVLWFAMTDPDGHAIEFVQAGKNAGAASSRATLRPVSEHMIHAGFVVHDRAAEDRFYKDLLGFRLYWHGGMKDDQTDWVDMQVPDGRDWLEYMLLHGSEAPSPRILGILNHAALGVPDMKQAAALLSSRGWKPTAEEKTQIGKDGKWQLNLYDPDGTRIEMMEFRPVQKPCCAPYTGEHPQ